MDYSDAAKNRLRRVEGQVRGVLAMMEQTKECGDVITQLTAVRSAVDKAIATIVAENLETCIRAEVESGSSHSHIAIQEAIQLLIRSR
ncbi:metal-sensitive transcriptional regulator [Alicyclobacillaceae bacterium I2511]|nr:metal-sensitive transcriptional regulator [Alicyclobacillaceae bacterium I2511]